MSENADMKAKLSTLWVFATLNYLYCDVVTLMDPVKHSGSIQFTQGFLLGAAILVEIPIAMVLLSRIVESRKVVPTCFGASLVKLYPVLRRRSDLLQEDNLKAGKEMTEREM